jgi:hypothetical protein
MKRVKQLFHSLINFSLKDSGILADTSIDVNNAQSLELFEDINKYISSQDDHKDLLHKLKTSPLFIISLTNCQEKEIGFPENQIEFRGFLLALFHEIGHSYEILEHPATKWETLKALTEGISKWIKSLRITKDKEKNAYNITSLPAKALLPNWYLDKKSEMEAKSERDAWAYSLNSLRKFNQDGYNVFAGFENTAQIRAYVEYCLYTYDTELFMRKLMSGDLEGVEKLSEKSLFSKSSKKRNRIVMSNGNSGN